VPHGQGKKCVAASGQTFPADDQAAVLPLEPGNRPLGLGARDILFDRTPPGLVGVPPTCGNLRPNLPRAAAMTESFGIIALIRGQGLEPRARAAPFACADVQGSQQGRMTCARSSPLAGVGPVDNGMPAPFVRLWMKRSLPFRPQATPSPPPLPGGKRAIHGTVWPLHHPTFFGQPQQAGGHRCPGPTGLPALPPPLRRTFGRPWSPAREITPAAASDQDIASGIDDLATGGMGHTPPPLRRFRRTNIRNELPLQVASPLEGSHHRALLSRFRA
jgi:hypothetical protein